MGDGEHTFYHGVARTFGRINERFSGLKEGGQTWTAPQLQTM